MGVRSNSKDCKSKSFKKSLHGDRVASAAFVLVEQVVSLRLPPVNSIFSEEANVQLLKFVASCDECNFMVCQLVIENCKTQTVLFYI